jgi:hypothetical protein
MTASRQNVRLESSSILLDTLPAIGSGVSCPAARGLISLDTNSAIGRNVLSGFTKTIARREGSCDRVSIS